MPKPFTRAQQMENRAFLRALRHTGNVAEAARTLGFTRSRFLNRRRVCPAFAARWEAVLALAQAAFRAKLADGKPAPYNPGKPCIRRSNRGHLQVRRYRPGSVDHSVRQRFLAALSATANVRLSSAAVGFSPGSLYRERHRNSAFAREWQLALEMGYERLEMALLESAMPESFADDDWRRNDPPAIPRMTANQALQLLYLHQKEARLGGTPEPLRRRKGESRTAQHERLALMGEHRIERNRLAFRIAEAERLARGEPIYIDWEAEGNPLPDLNQVTGWSKAKGKAPADPTRALFGGRRIGDIPPGKRKG